jgi:hypothetical protein
VIPVTASFSNINSNRSKRENIVVKKLVAIGEIVLGFAIVVGGGVAGVAWLGFCFGTVIIGIALLFIEPMILLAPFLIGLSFGGALVASGYNAYSAQT